MKCLQQVVDFSVAASLGIGEMRGRSQSRLYVVLLNTCILSQFFYRQSLLLRSLT